jgi:hypothetical protein
MGEAKRHLSRTSHAGAERLAGKRISTKFAKDLESRRIFTEGILFEWVTKKKPTQSATENTPDISGDLLDTMFLPVHVPFSPLVIAGCLQSGGKQCLGLQ